MKTLLLDTNFLLLAGTKGKNALNDLESLIAEQHQLATLTSMVSELESMKESSSKRAAAAKVALKLIEQKKIKVLETSLKADESLADYAIKHEDTIVCTNDGELKKELKKHNIEVVGPKGRKYLTFI
jgi:rRNA-processing protein FCF1